MAARGLKLWDKRSARRLGIFLFLLLLVAALAWWTMIWMPGSSYRGELPALDEAGLALASQLRRDVTRLAVDIGPRDCRVQPEKLAEAAEFLREALATAGHEVQAQTFDVGRVECVNLEVEIPGSSRASEVVVVGAHYDSVFNSPAANDNGTGVAALLALARRLAGTKPERTLRLVAFTNEEPPFFQTERMGSAHYAKRCRERDENIVAMISLETMGYFSDEPGSQQFPSRALGMWYPDEGNFIAFVGNVGSRALVRKAVRSFRAQCEFPCEGAALPGALPGIGWSDHWSFWQEGYPGIMGTDTAPFRYDHYHGPEDTPDKVDFDRLARVVRGVESVIRELAGISE